jgi:hypothetical protein
MVEMHVVGRRVRYHRRVGRVDLRRRTAATARRLVTLCGLGAAVGCQLLGGIEEFSAASNTDDGGRPVDSPADAAVATAEAAVAADGATACTAPTDGCPPEIVAQRLAEPRDIGVCNGRVYWAEWAGGAPGGAFRSCAVGQSCGQTSEVHATDLHGAMLVSGGCSQLMFTESLERRVYNLTRDANGVLSKTLLADDSDQTDEGSFGGASFGNGLLVWSAPPSQIRRCTPPACQTSRGNFQGGRTDVGPMYVTLEVKDKSGGDQTPKPLVVWAESRNGGQLFRCTPGCLGTSNASPPAQGEIVDLVVSADGTTYYYLTTGGSLLSVPAMTPTTATTIATGLDSPTRLALDETAQEFYVTSATAGTIVRVALGSNERRVLFSGQSGPWGIAFDQNTIYWANSGDGTVARARVR